MHVNVKRTRKRDAQIEKLKCYLLSVVIACGVEFSMSSSSSSEDEGSESDTSQPPVAAVAIRSDTPAPQRTSRKMQSDAQERGAAPAATGLKATAKRSPQSKQQQPAESGRKVQDDKPTPRKDARQRQKEGSAQEATLAEKTRKRERPETPPRGHVAKGEVLQDLPNVVKRFARGWMEEKQYTLLYNATKELQITVPRDLRKHYDSFRKNLLMASDKEGDYNRSVSRALGEMSGIRRHLARADEPLSNEQTEECLMAWAEEHYFTRAEHRKDAHERQKILSDIFVRELGCKYRMRVVLQRGLQDFHGLTKDTDMLHAFLKYVITVEQQAEKLRKPASDSSSEKDMPAPASAAPERAVSQKRPPTAPIPAEGTSGKKETKDPPARKIKKGGKGEVLEEPAPGKKKPKRLKKV